MTTTETMSRAKRQSKALIDWHNSLSTYVAIISGSTVLVRGYIDSLENKATFEARIAKMNAGFKVMVRGMSAVDNAIAPIVDLADFIDRNPDTLLAAALATLTEIDVVEDGELRAARDRLIHHFWFLKACSKGIEGGEA